MTGQEQATQAGQPLISYGQLEVFVWLLLASIGLAFVVVMGFALVSALVGARGRALRRPQGRGVRR